VDKHKEALDMNDNKIAEENLLNMILVEKGMRELASLKVFPFLLQYVGQLVYVLPWLCLKP
jgi:hypothetical protein